MLIATLEFVVLLAACAGALLVYRRLVNSPTFSRFVNSILRVPPEQDEEIAEAVAQARREAARRTEELVGEIRTKRTAAKKLRDSSK